MQKMAQEADPDNRGDIDKVNKYCETVEDASGNITILPYIESGKYGWFDITHPLADPFPAQYVIGFLNQHWVQAALGVPVNFTMSSATVAHAFSVRVTMSKVVCSMTLHMYWRVASRF
jgi:hypothetical protein